MTIVDFAAARMNGRASSCGAAQISAARQRGYCCVCSRQKLSTSGRGSYDLDRIGQYEDDLVQIASALQTERPDARLWLAGHSMGGGIVLRFALKTARPDIAGYVLIAPVFASGPLVPKPSLAPSAIKIDRLRIMSLFLLNLLGIRAFNHLPVTYLNQPPDYPAYSFSAMASGWPTPPKSTEDGLRAMKSPFLILAGADDIHVRAEGYAELTGKFASGGVRILPKHSHDSLLNDCETHSAIAAWLEDQLAE
ncbi:alpha/beta hydrolase [Phaeobacter sp. S60]|jgi:alpha-beta hydrolase superfamily lysophospholipase|uniref:alpha/beta hydrolase n=1 Tax=Phaeobacter sp. S60 TaxID=1569353 RepID=UPI00058D7BB7|nr:alpha/beta fold hydrolase [Phaeobacter sp. S60]KII12755.1 hypothetical protein OO25_16465 [Phaeobacter sp. S60]